MFTGHARPKRKRFFFLASLKPSLMRRAMVSVAVTVLLVFGAASLLQLHQLKTERTTLLSSRGALLAEIQAKALSTAVWNLEKDLIQEMLVGLGSDPDFAGARVLDPQGQTGQSHGNTDSKDAVLSSASIIYDSQNLGSLELYLSTENLQKELRRETLVYLGFGLLMVAITSLALYGSLRMIFLPLMQLRGTMLTLAEGNTSAPIYGLERSDEIGAMAQAVDTFKQNKLRADSLSAEQLRMTEAERLRSLEISKFIEKFISGVSSSMTQFHSATEQLRGNAQGMRSSADGAQEQVRTMIEATNSETKAVDALADSAEKLEISINQIGEQIEQSISISQDTVARAKEASNLVESLSEAASNIGDIVDSIDDVAKQTNLLALNARIEAERTGEAGKGFVVVANEVKVLANQTKEATKTITNHVAKMQSVVQNAVTAICSILSTISKMDGVTQNIRTAKSQQDEITQQIGNDVMIVVSTTQDISRSIKGVSNAMDLTRTSAHEIGAASVNLSEESLKLRQIIDDFIEKVR